MINREIAHLIESKIGKGKAIIVFGPRQSGKTTLLKNIFSGYAGTTWLNADEQDVRNIFENPSATLFKQIFAKSEIVIIDEAQRIKDIGVK